ncbi:MAG: glycosyltransferase family 4 protein [Anaerolineales bacterium]|nr:glycosyltransferase family 4 protein [Anaerolineales bacterium]
MRLLYFTRDYTTHDHRILASLADTEHAVYYLRLERRNRQLEDRPLPPQVKIVPWAGGQETARLRQGPRLLLDLRRVIRQIKPDLIHAGPIQTCAFLVALSGFQPLVSMSWGSDMLVDAGRNRFYQWATRYTLRYSRVLFGDCDAVRQKAATFDFPPERAVIFPWGIDLERFSPGEDGGLRERKGWQDNFVLLHLRSWEPIYGVDVLAKGFVIAAQQRPELRLFLLGGGSLASSLRRMLSNGGVLDKVHFGGQVSQGELPRYYRAADLYLSASHSDGSSVSLMEALGSGLPVLVSDIPGNREWVTPGEQGWWFPDNDPYALAEGIVRAAEQRERLLKMRTAARALAEERADWNKNFEKMLAGYQMALELK